MKQLKNTLEELVVDKVEAAFKNVDESKKNIQNMKDVVVYILNNIKPRYIISTRGMLHEATNSSAKQKIENEINGIMSEAVDQIIKNPRSIEENSEEKPLSLREIFGMTDRFSMTDYFSFNFPFFIGNVKNSKTDKPLSGIEAALYINGELAEEFDSCWPNPYITSDKSECKFAFWPKPLRADNDEAVTYKDMVFEIKFSGKGILPSTTEFTIKLESQKYTVNFVREDYTKEIGTIGLNPK